MKIALFHNLLKGGGKRALYELSSLLSKKHKLDLYSFSACKEFLRLDTFCTKTYRFRSYKQKNFLNYQYYIYIKLPKIHRAIAKQINKRDYDVVFVNTDYLTKAPYILRYLEIPSLYLCPEPPREFYENIGLYSGSLKYKIVDMLRIPLKTIDFFNARCATVIISNSNYSKIMQSKIYRRKVKSLRHGVNTEYFKYLNRKKEKLFLTIGALSKFKGYDFLIRSIAKLPEEKKYPLVIVANGGRDERYIMRLAERLAVELIIKRKISDDSLLDLYNRAALFLFAARKEPLGLSILESEACGLPVVAVNEGGVREIVNKRFCLLTQRKEDDFRDAVMKLLNRTWNRKYRSELAKETKERWGWDKAVDELERYLFLVKNENRNC